MTQTQNLREILSSSPVLPVLVIHHLRHAVPLARALVAGGLKNLEITLRTPAALDAIREIAIQVPEAVVGAGTVTEPGHLDAVAEAGGRFAVSPGLSSALRQAASGHPLPLVPGVMTPSEAMNAHDAGFHILKLFPAEAAGGRALLKAMAGPLPNLMFCPTGGVTAHSFRDYLALDNVICVGGSWVAPSAVIAAEDWPRITALAAEVV